MTVHQTNDLYADLGVSPTATAAEIKAAARRGQKKHHPDAGGNQDDFVRVQNALKVLSDPDKRAHYDRTGDTKSGSPEEAERAEAMGVMAQFANKVMEGADPRYADLPKGILELVAENIRQHRANLEAARLNKERSVNILGDFLKRLKAGDDPLLRQMLEAQLFDMERTFAAHKANTERVVRISERVEAMVNGYEYEVEEKPYEPPQPSWINSRGPTMADIAELMRQQSGGRRSGPFG